MEEIRQTVLLSTPRILGLMDRDRQSSTLGCCDRNFWHYKLHDVSNARFQEAALLLALLYDTPMTGSRYHRNRALLDWALSAVGFWSGRLNGDGSCVEVYPFERSFCATSFSTFAVTEALITLEAAGVEAAERATAFIKAVNLDRILSQVGRWLAAQLGDAVSNQLAAAALALLNISRLGGRPEFHEAGRRAVDMLVAGYKRHGHFSEYGGFDLGYQSITNSCLALYAMKSEDAELLAIVKESAAKLDAWIGEDGNYDCTSMSRKTQFLYPFGFMAVGSPAAGKLCAGIRENRVITPLWMDDRYAVPLTVDYMLTCRERRGP